VLEEEFKMKLNLAFVGVASAVRVAWDTNYDNRSGSLNTVSCSNGPNGLINRYNWSTLADVPTFPLVGAFDAIAGWNSPNVRNLLAINEFSTLIYSSVAIVTMLLGVAALCMSRRLIMLARERYCHWRE
jgi:hypothetical protein